MRFKSITTALVACVLMNGAFAEEISIIGSKKFTLKQTRATSSRRDASGSSNHGKVIQLLRVQLSDEAKALLKSRAKDASEHTRQFSTNLKNSLALELPNKVELGMNKVPVLDQGMHGTCVTFAVTGALDAIISKGDYISQVCNLQLGSYLEKHGYGLSGWDGSYAINVINQIEQYGAVNRQNQKSKGCGGFKEYPTHSSHNPGSFIEPEKFRAMSEFIFGKLANWSDVYQQKNPVKTLEEVKQALQSKDRLVFAVLLPRTDLGTAGAVGKHNTYFYKDSWVLTPEILKAVDNVEDAHEMIITGYDDNAVAVDDKGKKHKGLLTLRNSWGTSVGDDGEFYMSYDYFKLLAFDVTRFSPQTM
ncbi:C1 family peptidase [Legionella hackeliae]|uniref:Cysteine protease, papain C1 family n=1 Tax=Legionella hackeliae TaxID=449 RepID=A0A0A8URK2_LEGHA|nr:C1 family peptidase [Legionella hackeliae]KTD15255.1 cysteine protease [Legionella hackeliae]CEK11378.1 Cysteine protease, papain C1 family [Legionella hackeliae]STX48150.1 cysteine protease, papain C1 family [Legionella hackeliae]